MFSWDFVICCSNTFNTTKTIKHELALEDDSKHVRRFSGMDDILPTVISYASLKENLYILITISVLYIPDFFHWQYVSTGAYKALLKKMISRDTH